MNNKRTPEIEEAVLEGIAAGHRLVHLCKVQDISRSAFLMWMRKDPDLAQRFSHAESTYADSLAQDAIHLADFAHDDWIDRRGKPGREFDYEHVRRVKLRIDSRFRQAARIDNRVARRAFASASASASPSATAPATAPLDRAAILTQVRDALDDE